VPTWSILAAVIVNLRARLQLSKAPQDSALRACSCSFCRAHCTRTFSDPMGLFEVWANDWSLVEAYRCASKRAF